MTLQPPFAEGVLEGLEWSQQKERKKGNIENEIHIVTLDLPLF